jgi:DNA-binding CsgD family transcriptional regulator/N-acetylneuraminic acid mutarotase
MQNDPQEHAVAELTEREKEILRLLATGTSNKEIAQELFISSNTVKVHLRNIFSKIGVVSRTEAAMYAVRIGLVKSPAATGQEDNPPQAGTFQLELQTTPIDIARQPIPGVRPRNVASVIAILLLVVAVGFLLARREAAFPTKIIQITPTPESRWHALAALPTARSGLAVTAYENQVYAIGGDSAQGVTGVLERYDPANDSWVELAKKPVPVADVNAAVIGGKIYVPGGRTSTGAVTNVLEIYDPRQGSWEDGKNLPIAISAYAMAPFEGRLYLFGGWDGKKYLDSVYIYDPGLQQWTELTAMPEARGFASAAVAEDRIYVIGGYNGSQALAVNEVFTPHLEGLSSAWNKVEALPFGRYNIGIATIADNVYIIGGQEATGSLSAYLPQTNKWQTFDPSPFEIGDGPRLVLLGEFLLVIGGKVNNIPSTHNLAYRAIYTVEIPLIIH